MARNDPLRNFRFRLEIDGIQQAGFSEVAIAETTTDAVDYREGNEPAHVHKLPGLNKFGNITLKYGFTTDSMQLYAWHKAIVDGQIATNRKKVVIVAQEVDGSDKARFVVSEAWPLKYDPSDLNAKGNEVFIETLELCNEGIERVL
jgi:phage tail-like protein